LDLPHCHAPYLYNTPPYSSSSDISSSSAYFPSKYARIAASDSSCLDDAPYDSAPNMDLELFSARYSAYGLSKPSMDFYFWNLYSRIYSNLVDRNPFYSNPLDRGDSRYP
jgi:hypothetical protein